MRLRAAADRAAGMSWESFPTPDPIHPPAPPALPQGDTMQMHEVEQIEDVYSTSSAQQLLDEGWSLIAVLPGQGSPVYVMGRKKPKDQPPAGVPLNTERSDSPRR